MECKIAGQSKDAVFYMQKGRKITIKKNLIRRITYGETEEEKAKKAANEKMLADMKKQMEEYKKQGSDTARMQENLSEFEKEVKKAEEKQKADEKKRKEMIESIAGELAAIEKEEEELKKQQGSLAERKDSMKKQMALQNPSSVIWRSIVFPGWGQMHRGDRLRGKIFAGSFIAAGLYHYMKKQEYRKDLDLYNNQAALGFLIPQRPFLIPLFSLNYIQTQSYFEKTKTDVKNTNRIFYLISGIYLWNLADAVFALEYGKKDKSVQSHKPTFYFSAFPEKTDRGRSVSGNFAVRMAF